MKSNGENSLAAIYYIPEVPNIKSTTRYNHAIALARRAQLSVLITNTKPPEHIYEEYDSVHVLGKIKGVRSMIKRVLQARKIVSRVQDRCRNDRTVYVTNFTYAQVLSGFLSDIQWIVDIYDDPLQLSIRRPFISPHQIASRILLKLIDRSDVGITTLHPDGPRSQLGQSTQFTLNGSPISSVEYTAKPPRSPLRCVWVGKTEVGCGIELLLKSLTDVSSGIVVDVYGEPISDAKSLAAELDVCDRVRFHGGMPHERVLSAIEDAHVGLCVLTPHDDFKYSFPIKVGEYLAAGAIPVMSDFPGMRMLAQNAGIYIKPNHHNLANTLQKLITVSDDEVDRLASKARERAETISWEIERERFADHVIDSL
jgi:hypothetical protein